jgi:succinyl-diaminopimelate desuccinylase
MRVPEFVEMKVNERKDIAIRNLVKLIEIPTQNPPGEAYGELVEFVEEYLSEQGVKVEVFRVPDDYASRFYGYDPKYPRYILIARVGNGQEVLHLNGHYDVVPPGTGWTSNPFKPVIIEDKLYGRGASDMKSGVTSIVETIVLLKEFEEKLNYTVTLSLVPDEETTSMGTKYILERRLTGAEYAIIAEPTSLKHIDIGCKGGVWLLVCVEGVQAHASRPWLGENAFEKAVMLAGDILRELKPKITARASTAPFADEKSRKATIELGGYVRGGSKSNTVPAEFCFSIDRRILPEEDPEKALEEILSFLEQSASKQGAKYKISVEDIEKPYLLREGMEFVELLARITEAAIGHLPTVSVKTGFTEMALFGNAGIKAITFGPGNEEVAHVANEYVSLKEVINAIKIYTTLALKLAARD